LCAVNNEDEVTQIVVFTGLWLIVVNTNTISVLKLTLWMLHFAWDCLLSRLYLILYR